MNLTQLIKPPLRLFPTTLVFCLTLLGSLILSSHPVSANELSDQFTISLWVKPESSIANKALVSKAEEIRLVTDSSGNPLCQVKATTWQTAVTSSTVITVDNWSHVTCVYDKAALRIFINGVQTGSQALTVTVDSTSNVFKLGEDDSSGTTYGDLAGVVDNFLVYDYVRTSQQIVEDMNAGHPPPGSPIGSPVVHFKFDEGYGTVANNAGSGGSALNGTLTNMASPATATSGWSNNGKFDKALSFDGSNDHISVPVTGLPTLQGVKSVSVWIKYSAIPGSSNAIWTFTANDSSGLPDDSINLGIGRPTNKIQVAKWGGTSLVEFDAPPAGDWYNITYTYDGTNHKLYLNGNLKNQSTATGDSGATNYAYLGKFNTFYPDQYAGQIDDFKIYTYALTDDQVKAEYNMGKATVLGSLSTDATGVATNTSDRSYCPPGDSTGSCGPVAEWKFDENTGTTNVNDTSGNANHGTMNGGMTNANWIPGKEGSALSFDGNDHILVGDNNSLDTTGSVTLQAWIKPSSLTNYATIMGKRHASSTSANYAIRMGTGTNSDEFEFYFANAGWHVYTTNNASLVANNWYFVTAVYDGSSVKIYKNGVLLNGVCSAGTCSASLVSDTNSVGIGRPGDFASEYFSGLIDQVRIYNYARTPAQIAWDYNRGKPVAHYKLDECSGTTIHSTNDAYNSALNGTWIGSGGSQTSVGDCSTSGTAWGNGATGKLNASLNFDGTDDFIDAGSSNDFDDLPSKSSLSVSAWIKTPSSWSLPSPTQQSVFVGKNSSSSNGWQLYNQYNGKPTFLVNYTTDGVARSSSVLATNTWYHLVGVFDSSSGSTRLFINGVEANYQGLNGLQQSAVGTYASDAAYNLNIARGGAGGADVYFSGQIDDVQIFNYALTPQQIQTVMNSGAIRYGD